MLDAGPVVTGKRAEIVRALSAEIDNGTYGHDQQLPTEIDLSERFGCARGTVQAALRHLEQIGDVERVPRHGWYVRTDRRREFPLRAIDSTLPGMDEWETFCARNRLAGDQRVTVAHVVPPEHIAEHLGVSATSLCIARTRLRLVYSVSRARWEPWARSVAWFPLDLFADTHLARTGTGEEVDLHHPTSLDILRDHGHLPLANRDVIGSREVNPETEEDLGLQPGSIVLTVCRTSTDPAGVPVRCVTDLLSARRFYLVVEGREK